MLCSIYMYVYIHKRMKRANVTRSHKSEGGRTIVSVFATRCGGSFLLLPRPQFRNSPAVAKVLIIFGRKVLLSILKERKVIVYYVLVHMAKKEPSFL